MIILNRCRTCAHLPVCNRKDILGEKLKQAVGIINAQSIFNTEETKQVALIISCVNYLEGDENGKIIGGYEV